MLDADNFVAANRDPAFMDRPAPESFGRAMMLPPYAVLRLRGS